MEVIMSSPYTHIRETLSGPFCPDCDHPIDFCVCKPITKSSDNNGGSTDYYKLPISAKDLQDLIEHKNMDFALGNIFKACYRLGECSHSEAIRDLNKIIWFAERKIKQLTTKDPK